MSPPLLAAELPPVDACPSCDPGVPAAALPAGVPEVVDGGVLASYECELCGTGWTTRFDVYGWVVERSVAPVSPERAERSAAA